MIYVLRECGSSIYKIGYTALDSAEERRRQLQTANPRKLEVICMFDGDETLESELHRELWAYRTEAKNEWFESAGRGNA